MEDSQGKDYSFLGKIYRESKRTLIKANFISYHLKKRATRQFRHAREPSSIPLLFLRGLNKKNSMLKKFVFKKISMIELDTDVFKAPSL